MLDGLGINTNPGARLDPNEKSLAEDYNPIGPKVGLLFKQCEIYGAGMTLSGANNGLLNDRSDGNGAYSLLFQETDADWGTGYPKRSVAADVDGDGLDEVVTAIFYDTTDEIVLRLVDYQGVPQVRDEVRRFDSVDDLSETLNGTAGGSSSWEDAFFRQHMAAGDLDGDGRDELVLVEAGQIYVLDDIRRDFATLQHITLENLDPNSDTYIRVALADYDMDGSDEIVVVNGEANSHIQAEYTIFDDLANDPDMSHPLISAQGIYTTVSATVQLHTAGVVTGDFDGDGLPETAFAGQRMDSSAYAVMILDTYMDADSRVRFNFLNDSIGDNNEKGYFIPPMAAGDMDGDGVDELVVWEDVYRLSTAQGEIVYDDLWGNEALTLELCGDRDDAPSADVLSLGDVTGDKRADVVFYTDGGDRIRVVSVKSDGRLGYEDIIVGSGPSRPTLCLPNVDDDSAVLEFLSHEVLFTDPIVVAVIASPPYWEGVNGGDQGYEGSTSFGYISGQSAEESQSHGFSVGVSFGTSFELPYGIASAELKTTVENSFNWGVASTHEVTESWGYTTTLGEDKVVFTAIPFDVYYYRTLSSPDPEQIGETVTINIPRSPGKYHQELGYYNSHNGDGYDVSSDAVSHVPGDPFSYAGESEKDSLKDTVSRGLFSEHHLWVGVGSSGSSEISLEDLQGETSSYDYELDISVEAEIGVGGITAGVSGGFNYGYSYATTYTTGTYIAGSVPDVPEAFQLFHWGLLAYPVSDRGQQFTLISYWTEPN